MPKLPKNNGFSEKMYHQEHDPEYYLVKANAIVQKTHFTMSLNDQKVLASLIRSIKPHQKGLTVTFSTEKYIKMLGLRSSPANFAYVMKSLSSIYSDWFFILRPDGKYETWRWIDKIVADPNAKHKGRFYVTFRPELKHYLFNQSLKYKTIYKFSDIMLMRNRYSPRLYEIFRSNQSRQKIRKQGLNYSVNELKNSLNLIQRTKNSRKPKHDSKGHKKYKYKRFSNFANRVLIPARREINMLTEFNVSFHKIKQGRKIVGINVVMIPKTKKELKKRKEVIYFITHHIPKSQWKNWRKNVIEGKSHEVKHNKKSSKKASAQNELSQDNQEQSSSNTQMSEQAKQLTEKNRKQAELIKKLLNERGQNQPKPSSEANQSNTISHQSVSEDTFSSSVDNNKDFSEPKKSHQQVHFEKEANTMPWTIFNKKGSKFEYYNPELKRIVWTTQAERDKNKYLYDDKRFGE